MFELFALFIYGLQWLGVVLGVGAEVVLLVAHLIALHDRKPNWLESVPAVRTSQFFGLALIVLSGGAAVYFHIATGQQALILLPVFGFKWALIIALAVCYALERNLKRGKAVLEGIAGATWLALFLVHTVAPETDWVTLGVFYGLWVALFAFIWTASVFAMKRAARAFTPAVSKEIPIATPKPISNQAPIPKPISAAPVKLTPVLSEHKAPPAPVTHSMSQPKAPPASRPIVAAAPAPAPKPKVIPKIETVPAMSIVTKPKVMVVAHTTPTVALKKIEEPAVIKETRPSFFKRLLALFARAHKEKPVVPSVTAPEVVPKPVVTLKVEKPAPAPVKPIPIMAAVSAPLPKPVTPQTPVPVTPVAEKKPEPPQIPHDPSKLPVVEHLELNAPKVEPKPAPEPAYVPDWAHMPGLRVMPQKPEDLHTQNRAPLIRIA